jgi:hypothetical protein
VEDIDAADWFVDLDGYATVVPLMDHENPEIRMAAAWIVSNSLQNNPKVQQKFLEKVGLGPCLESLVREQMEKPAVRKMSLVSNAIRAFKPLREQFYGLDGISKIKGICERFSCLCFRFCWLVGAVLDEEDAADGVEFKKQGLNEFFRSHAEQIADDDILQSVVSRLQ